MDERTRIGAISGGLRAAPSGRGSSLASQWRHPSGCIRGIRRGCLRNAATWDGRPCLADSAGGFAVVEPPGRCCGACVVAARALVRCGGSLTLFRLRGRLALWRRLALSRLCGRLALRRSLALFRLRSRLALWLRGLALFRLWGRLALRRSLALFRLRSRLALRWRLALFRCGAACRCGFVCRDPVAEPLALIRLWSCFALRSFAARRLLARLTFRRLRSCLALTRLRGRLMLLLLLIHCPIGCPQRRRSLHVAVGRKRLLDGHIRRAAMICTGKLGAVGAGGALILELCSHGRSMLLPHCHPLRGPRRNMETTRSAVVTHMGVVRVRATGRL